MADNRPRILVKILLAARKLVIGKRRIGADEHVVFQGSTVPQLNATFDRHSISHYDVVFNENVITNIATLSNPSAGQDV